MVFDPKSWVRRAEAAGIYPSLTMMQRGRYVRVCLCLEEEGHANDLMIELTPNEEEGNCNRRALVDYLAKLDRFT